MTYTPAGGDPVSLIIDGYQHIAAHVNEQLAGELPTTGQRKTSLYGAGGYNHDLTTPKLKIGQWYYPWGASRFSRCVALIAGDELAKLAYAGANGGTLSFKGDQTIQTTMYPLPAKPLAQFPHNQQLAEELYLITFVDERYFWRWKYIQHVSSDTTWSDYRSGLAGALGIVDFTGATVDTKYLKYCGDSELGDHCQNAAVAMDAALSNIGQRLVRNLDGSYDSVLATNARTTFDSQVESLTFKAGGLSVYRQKTDLRSDRSLCAVLPESVLVTFPKATGHLLDGCEFNRIRYPLNGGEYYTKTVTTDGYVDMITVPQTVKVFHDTAIANYSYDEEGTLGEDPDNKDDLDDLASQITKDWAYWQSRQGDFVINGYGWTPEAFADVIYEYSKGYCTTRVFTTPATWDFEELSHYAVSGRAKIGVFTGTTTEVIEAFTGSGLVQVTNFGVEEEEYIVEVFNPYGTEIDEDKRIAFAWNNLACHFEVIAEDCT